MFFFTGYTFLGVLVALVCLFSLVLLNEVTRRSKVLGLLFYVFFPLIATFFIWPRVAGNGGSNGGTWFSWAKTYSALAGVWIFMFIRYVPKLRSSKVMLTLPAAILAINIAEAIASDLECFTKHGVMEAGLLMEGGPWNILNAIAGVLLILTLSGWLGITVSRKKSQDMIWPDQLWFWIVAYDLWNMSYCYNCISNRSFYAGFILLVSCTLCEFVFRKGAWLQHRAQTLALWAMFSLTVDYAAFGNLFPLTSTQAPAPKMVLAILSLLANVLVLVFEVKTIRKNGKNPLKEPVYSHLESYRKVLEDNELA